MIKAIFLDVDGTLIHPGRPYISPEMLEALHSLRAKGIKLCISTGRSREELAFIEDAFSFDAYIGMNGQFCYTDTEVFYADPIKPEDVKLIAACAPNYPFTFCFVEPDDKFIDKLTDECARVFRDISFPAPRVADISTMNFENIYQLVVVLPREDEHIITDASPNVAITRWHPNFVDVMPIDGGKDVGIAVCLERFGLDASEIMAIGDGDNDKTMLSFAGLGVAMGNADDDVKAVADYVTGTVLEDGALAALRHFGLV